MVSLFLKNPEIVVRCKYDADTEDAQNPQAKEIVQEQCSRYSYKVMSLNSPEVSSVNHSTP